MTPETIVLLVEDDPGHAGLIRRNLQRAGIANPVIHFTSGERLLAFFARQGALPHREPGGAYLLLLDQRLPGLSGLEVLSHMKDDPLLAQVPVILVTTSDDPQELDRCRDLGCAGCMQKSVDYGQFVASIHTLADLLLSLPVPPLAEIAP